jgi:hypothetical protein
MTPSPASTGSPRGLGDPGDAAYLADLQDEARRRLPVADLVDRVVVVATAPQGPGAVAGRSLRGPLRLGYVIQEPERGTARGPFSTQPRAFPGTPQRR